MRKLLLLLVLALLLSVRAAAGDIMQQEAELLQLDTLYDALTPDARTLLGEATPTTSVSFGKSLLSMLYDVLGGSESALQQAGKSAATLLCVVLLCAITHGLELPFSDTAISLVGALGITLVCTQSLSGMVTLAGDTLDRLSGFTTLLLPALSSVLMASGGLTAGAALYTGSCIFIDLLVRCVKMLLLPLTYAYLALAAASCAAGASRLRGIQELVGWTIRTALKGIMYVFTAYISLTGLVSGSADAATLKAAKAALSGVVPVVGGIISDASESVLAAAAALKATAGIFGLLAIAALVLSPFIRIGLFCLAMKLTGAVGGVFALPAHASLLSDVSTAMGYLLAMTGSCALMAMLSCCCFMRAVSG